MLIFQYKLKSKNKLIINYLSEIMNEKFINFSLSHIEVF